MYDGTLSIVRRRAMDFRNLYMPVIAGSKNYTYIERTADAALAPYVRCYWYQENIPVEYDNLVIPDTCVDIIFSVSEEGIDTATFCGVNDKPYFNHITSSFAEMKVFAVRFYAWSFSILSGDTLQSTRNIFADAEPYMSAYVNEIKRCIGIDSKFDYFIDISNRILIKHVKERFLDANFMNALYHILNNRGNIRIDKLAGRCFIGRRQLERLFRARMDLSPKQFADLIRYQNAWRGIIQGRDVNDLVFQLGYSDQSHLLREFKVFHGITPREARLFARGTEKTLFR